ncbi:allatostatin-A receptor-like [Mytilus californianus]|uniref:allatostatin-A receptor-like n=1 Tax=Mytilus californianus TaxID=6549 RepID=UPI002245E661|nr:allatostatin-A receptor-like [Mytilus californianus]XP_052070575.1 allatostatin-A receptor-like [Mytilus californianus]
MTSGFINTTSGMMNSTMSNNLSESIQGEMESALAFERAVHLAVSIIFGIVVLVGFLGNLLVIIVVWSNTQMQNTTNILIVSLAFADLSFIIFCVPFTATKYVMSTWPFGTLWCKISSYLMYVCAFASVYTLVLMSLDRYLAVVHPITSMKIRNRRNANFLVVLTWIVILGSNLPAAFEFHVLEYKFYESNRSTCILEQNFSVARRFHGCFFAFGYVLPLTLICVLYGFMLKRLLYGVVPGGSQRAESIRSKKRVTKMIIIVVGIFALCWLPIQIMFLVQYFGHFEANPITFGIQMTANCLAYMNSCVNPILYAFLSENFRRSFRKLLCCKGQVSTKFEYERTHAPRGADKETKEMLLNNLNHTNNDCSTKDKNCNTENTVT